MQSRQVRVRASAHANDARARQAEQRLRRYAPHVRPRVRATAAQHPRLAEVAVAFPGLLFALALPGADVACARDGHRRATAARQWLDSHDLQRVEIQRRDRDEAPLDAATWRSFWRPYWLAKRGFPSWLPLAPSRGALRSL